MKSREKGMLPEREQYAYRRHIITENPTAGDGMQWHVTRDGFHIGWFRTKEEAEQTVDMLTE